MNIFLQKKLDKPYYMMYNIKARIVNCGDIREGDIYEKDKTNQHSYAFSR